jgi:hypothetical protein
MGFKIYLYPLLTLFIGWALSEGGLWLRYRRETEIENRERVWEKAETFEKIPRAWDYVFSKDRCYWLKIILKDGSKIGGYYGNKSFTSNYPHKDDLFVEDIWKLDEKETYNEHDPRGLLVEREEISYIEIYKIEERSDM